MWINRNVYQDLQNELVKARETATAEVVANRALKETLNWLMHRVTQLEKERVVMVQRIFDVKLPSPEFAPVPETKPEILPNPFGANSKLNEIADLFADMGDERAAKEGIQHDDEGAVVYTK